MKTVPSEKYPELQTAFPDQFVFFFDAAGQLNSLGKMAMEYLAMKKLLERVEFAFDSAKEGLVVTVGFIPVSEEVPPHALNELATAFLGGCGLPPVRVASQRTN